MKIFKLSDSGITYTGWGNDCGGFKPPAKGDHLDTQLFPGCRRKKKKKKVCKEIAKPVIETKTITAKHGQGVLDILDAWRNKVIDNEKFVKEIAKVITRGWVGISEDLLTRMTLSQAVKEALEDKNYDSAANKIATFLTYTEKSLEPGEAERKKKRDDALKFNLKRFKGNS